MNTFIFLVICSLRSHEFSSHRLSALPYLKGNVVIPLLTSYFTEIQFSLQNIFSFPVYYMDVFDCILLIDHSNNGSDINSLMKIKMIYY